jgi:adenylyltransferase/sulfurtransferase
VAEHGRIVVIGCGGLGVPAAWALVAAGVRRLRLVDGDRVELGNLHRQVLYREVDVGRLKAEALAVQLLQFAPDLEVEIHAERLADAADTHAVLAGCAAVLEGTDDAVCKFAVNDAAVALGLSAAAIAAAIGRTGQWFVRTPWSACYRCLFEEPPPADTLASCAVAGVLGGLTGQTGALAARALLQALDRDPRAPAGALIRLSPRGLQRHPVAIAADCPCQAGCAAYHVQP